MAREYFKIGPDGVLGFRNTHLDYTHQQLQVGSISRARLREIQQHAATISSCARTKQSKSKTIGRRHHLLNPHLTLLSDATQGSYCGESMSIVQAPLVTETRCLKISTSRILSLSLRA